MDILGTVVGGVGKLVDEAVTALTGSETLGDAAGVFTNLATGNLPGAVTEGLELLDDAQGRGGAQGGCHPATSAHPAASCPEWDASAPAGGTVRGANGGVDLARSTERAIEIARSAHVAGDHKVEVDVDVSLGEAGAAAAAAEGGVHVDVHVGWGQIVPDGPAQSLAAKLRSILDDPGLSLEDKVSMLFAQLIEGLDGKIEATMNELQAGQAARERAESGARGRPAGASGDAPSASDLSRISSELQLLMQRRSQMQALLSNLMSATHQSAMQTIANIR